MPRKDDDAVLDARFVRHMARSRAQVENLEVKLAMRRERVAKREVRDRKRYLAKKANAFPVQARFFMAEADAVRVRALLKKFTPTYSKGELYRAALLALLADADAGHMDDVRRWLAKALG